MKTNLNLPGLIVLALLFAGCQKDIETSENRTGDVSTLKKLPTLSAVPFATGFVSPIGLAMGSDGSLWVAENGLGRNDAKVKVVTKDGKVFTAITGFTSIIEPNEELPAGLTQLMVHNKTLYILHGVSGNLYMADISSFKPGDPPLHASNLQKENLSEWINTQNLVDPINSNIYDLVSGPGGDLYIADAGANAIIRRQKDGTLSVFARIPEVSPGVDAVPTGLVVDGNRFLVSTLGGFPFAPGASKIYEVSNKGDVSIYKGGLSTLTDIVLTPGKTPLVLQFAEFIFGPPNNVGFKPFSGKVLDADGNILLDNLMFPSAMVTNNGGNEFYVVSLALGIIYKL